MFQRDISEKLFSSVKSFYAVSLVGPRQSGKTTLLRYLYPEYEYINLEDPDMLQRIKLDPKGLLDTDKKWIIDEAQEYPELFSYLLGIIDKRKILGQFILSGSQNFLLMERISQSLAGRVAVLELLPLTYKELCSNNNEYQDNIWSLIYKGQYPGLYRNNIEPEIWYKSYVTTYIQRDVRQILKIKDLSKFYLFLQLCAARHGQLINFLDIGSACGISHTTIKEWINLLEASYIIFKLQPYYKNFNKRITKTPKLYFYDSGLVCHLLGIDSISYAKTHNIRGALFEGYIISEIKKIYFNKVKPFNGYFWLSNKGFELDLLLEKIDKIKAIEIKSSATFADHFLRQIKKWNELLINNNEKKFAENFIIYSGEESFIVNNINIVSYKDVESKLDMV